MSSEGGGGEGMNLFALSLDQLNQLKQSIEEVRCVGCTDSQSSMLSSPSCLRP